MPARFGQEPNLEFTIAEPRDDGINRADFTRECVHCDKTINWSHGESLWYHTETFSIRCDVDVESLKIAVDDYAES
jgi:hypothetical protein